MYVKFINRLEYFKMPTIQMNIVVSYKKMYLKKDVICI